MGEPRSEDWLVRVRRELRQISIDFPSHTIFRVPPLLIDEKTKISYMPCTVSIGPFHHKNPNLQSMEEHKKRYLLSLMRRTGNGRLVLDSCGNALLNLDERIRGCYAEMIRESKTELANILLVDCCFLIELFLRYSSQDDQVVKGDPVFENAWMKTALRRDLTLLENQIPFFVLEEIFNLTIGSHYKNQQLFALKTFVLQFFRWDLNLEDERAFHEKCNDLHRTDHLLDLIRKCHIPALPPNNRVNSNTSSHTSNRFLSVLKSFPSSSFSSSSSKWLLGSRKKEDNSPVPNQHDLKYIHSAKALDEAGIKFKRKTSQYLLDLKFHGGKFEIPQLLIHSWTESLFRNLIAFEQCCHDCPSYITSYSFLMDRLIDTPQDVSLLEKRHILKGNMGDAVAVAKLFNNLCKQVVLKDFQFKELCNDVDEYYRRMLPRYKASLKRKYFADPCRTIAFVVATLFLILASVQTVYTALSYYDSN